MVRAAVLKNKDPAQILEEMEKIDEMGKLRATSKMRNGLHRIFKTLQNIMCYNLHLSMKKS